MSAHGCVGQCPQCKQGCLICHPCLPTCSRVDTWSPKTSLNNQTLEDKELDDILDDLEIHGSYSENDSGDYRIEGKAEVKIALKSLITRECEKAIEQSFIPLSHLYDKYLGECFYLGINDSPSTFFASDPVKKYLSALQPSNKETIQ